MKAVVFTKYGTPDIFVYLMWDLEYAFGGLISLPRAFPLHKKVSFCARRSGPVSKAVLIKKKAFSRPSNPSPCKATDSILERSSKHYFRRKYLWSDGGENTIMYDRIAHWGIDLLPRRSLFRWERGCSVSSTSHLHF